MQENLPLNSERDYESFKMLHALQYERISKLEGQENYISTFVSGLSTITISYSFSTNKALNFITGFLLPLIFIAANIIASIYISKTRKFIKMHQNRAKAMREKFAPSLQDIYNKVKKEDSDKDKFNRRQQMKYLHYLIALIAFAIIIYYTKDLFNLWN